MLVCNWTSQDDHLELFSSVQTGHYLQKSCHNLPLRRRSIDEAYPGLCDLLSHGSDGQLDFVDISNLFRFNQILQLFMAENLAFVTLSISLWQNNISNLQSLVTLVEWDFARSWKSDKRERFHEDFPNVCSFSFKRNGSSSSKLFFLVPLISDEPQILNTNFLIKVSNPAILKLVLATLPGRQISRKGLKMSRRNVDAPKNGFHGISFFWQHQEGAAFTTHTTPKKFVPEQIWPNFWPIIS